MTMVGKHIAFQTYRNYAEPEIVGGTIVEEMPDPDETRYRRTRKYIIQPDQPYITGYEGTVVRYHPRPRMKREAEDIISGEDKS